MSTLEVSTHDGAACPKGGKQTVLLVNLGTPSAPTAEAVSDFLREFLSDPMVVDWPRWLWMPVLKGIILRVRPAKVAHMYESIWTEQGSPLAAGTERIAAGLRRLLGDGANVEIAYRYGRPGLAERLKGALESGGELIVVPLFPQRTASSSETIVDLLSHATKGADPDQGRRASLRLARIAPDDRGYIHALASRFRQACEAAGLEPDHLLLSFHGIPERVDRGEGGIYRGDCRATAQALLAELGWPPERATLAFQSRFGPERWLLPATAEVLAELPGKGVRSVAVIAPGFLTDGLETVEELGIRGRETFSGAGGEDFVLVPAVDDHPSLLASLRDLLNLHVGAKVRPHD